jgi:hypothetical protein
MIVLILHTQRSLFYYFNLCDIAKRAEKMILREKSAGKFHLIINISSNRRFEGLSYAKHAPTTNRFMKAVRFGTRGKAGMINNR